MNRSRDYYRKKRAKAIKRKRQIIKNYMPDPLPKTFNGNDIFNRDLWKMVGVPDNVYWWVKHEGELSKGKIHCSCPMCSFRSVPVQDKKNLDRMAESLKEYEEEYNYNFSKELNRINKRKNKCKCREDGKRIPGDHDSNVEKGIEDYKYEILLAKFRDKSFCIAAGPILIEEARGFIKNNHITPAVLRSWLYRALGETIDYYARRRWMFIESPSRMLTAKWYRYNFLRFLIAEDLGIPYENMAVTREYIKLWDWAEAQLFPKRA